MRNDNSIKCQKWSTIEIVWGILLAKGSAFSEKILKCINQNFASLGDDAPTNEIEMNVCDRASTLPFTNPFTCEKHKSATAQKWNTSNFTFSNVFARYVEQPCLLTLQFAYICIERRYCAQQINNSHNVNLHVRRAHLPLWHAMPLQLPFRMQKSVRGAYARAKFHVHLQNENGNK